MIPTIPSLREICKGNSKVSELNKEGCCKSASNLPINLKFCITRISGPTGPLFLAVDLRNTPKGCPMGPLF